MTYTPKRQNIPNARSRIHRGRPSRPILAGLLCGVLLVACANQGEADSPLTHKFTWLSYVTGDDIRAACGPGAPDKYRFVYNARYDEQLRSYDIQADGADQGGSMRARVKGPANISQLQFDDLLAPWRWKESETRLDGQEMEQLRQNLAEAGFFDRPDVGLELNSRGFYWAAVACVDGRFYFGGWQGPSEAFSALRFPTTLLQRDDTGVAVNWPRDLNPVELGRASGPAQERGGETSRFLITVGENGLEGGGLGIRNPF